LVSLKTGVITRSKLITDAPFVVLLSIDRVASDILNRLAHVWLLPVLLEPRGNLTCTVSSERSHASARVLGVWAVDA